MRIFQKNEFLTGVILTIVLGFAGAYVLTIESSRVQVSLDPQEIALEGAADIEFEQESPLPEIAIAGDASWFDMPVHTYQTFNNCGPATLSMLFAYYGLEKSQRELGELMRPYQNRQGNNDDKSVFAQEFVDWAEEFGLAGITRQAGNLELLKTLVENDLPVVVRTWLHVGEDIGHYRIVHGFDDRRQVIIQDDSYFGPDREISYVDFLAMWQPFGYEYFVIYPPEKEALVAAILGDDYDEAKSWARAEQLARQEDAANPLNLYPRFNLIIALYHQGRFAEAVAEYESIESALPSRMLWYQIEPILAYVALGQDAQAFLLIERVLSRGNRAFSELYQVRGDIYAARGETEKARAEYELALLYNKNFQPAALALEKLSAAP